MHKPYKDNAHRFLKEQAEWFEQNPHREFRLSRLCEGELRVIEREPAFEGTLNEKWKRGRGRPNGKYPLWREFQVVVRRRPDSRVEPVRVLVTFKIQLDTPHPSASEEELYCRELWALHELAAAEGYARPADIALQLYAQASALPGS